MLVSVVWCSLYVVLCWVLTAWVLFVVVCCLSAVELVCCLCSIVGLCCLLLVDRCLLVIGRVRSGCVAFKKNVA